MKTVNETSKKRSPRFSVLDAVIILLVIVAVAGVYFRYNIIGFISGAQNLEDYAISYSIKDIRYTTPNYINVGDEVYFADDGEHFGTLIQRVYRISALSGSLKLLVVSKFEHLIGKVCLSLYGVPLEYIRGTAYQ